MKHLPTLYKRTSKGQIQEWTIFIDKNSFFVREGIVGGQITQTAPHVCEAKNLGKANETSAEEQATKEAQSKWEKKTRRGYSISQDSIDSTGFEKPMKGDKWEDREDEITFPAFSSDKLNGVRVRITKDRAISTGGEIFYTIPHIHTALKSFFAEYPNATLDGEAFNYDLRENLNQLIKLVSVVIKEKDLTPELLARSKDIVQFHVFDGYGFDGVNKEDRYYDRFSALQQLLPIGGCVKLVSIQEVNSKEEIEKLLKENKKRKGEGLIIRWGECPYKHGRSKYLLKYKHWDDDEFELVDLEEGNGDWAGYAKRAIFKLKDTTFASNIRGDRTYLKKLLDNKKKLIGQKCTVSYQTLSEYGVPQLPWMETVRDYE